MAVRTTRIDPSTAEGIRRRRSPRQTRRHGDALSGVRQVVRHAASVDDAIATVRAIDSAWSDDVEPATREALMLLLTILELSDSVEDALASWVMVRRDGTLRSPLRELREFVQTDYPGATMQLVPGDDVASTYLHVRIPAEDYASFKAGYDRIREWSVQHRSALGGKVHVSPRRLHDDV